MYEQTIASNGHMLTVTWDGAVARAYHDGTQVGQRHGEGLIEFEAMEDGDRIPYDVLVLTRGYTRVKVGRSGRVIFSDYRSFPIDHTGET